MSSSNRINSINSINSILSFLSSNGSVTSGELINNYQELQSKFNLIGIEAIKSVAIIDSQNNTKTVLIFTGGYFFDFDHKLHIKIDDNITMKIINIFNNYNVTYYESEHLFKFNEKNPVGQVAGANLRLNLLKDVNNNKSRVGSKKGGNNCANRKK